jgi:hypothetical protein
VISIRHFFIQVNDNGAYGPPGKPSLHCINSVGKSKKPVKFYVAPGEVIIKCTDKSDGNQKKFYIIVFRPGLHAFIIFTQNY